MKVGQLPIITGSTWANVKQIEAINTMFAGYIKTVQIGVNSNYPEYVCCCLTDVKDAIYTVDIAQGGQILDSERHLY